MESFRFNSEGFSNVPLRGVADPFFIYSSPGSSAFSSTFSSFSSGLEPALSVVGRSNKLDVAVFRKSVESKVIPSLRDAPIEVGRVGEADREFASLLGQNELAAMNAINDAFIDHYLDFALSAQLLHLVSRLDSQVVGPTGPTMAAAAVASVDVALQEAGLRAYEAWANSKSLPMLRGLAITSPWLRKYRDQIVSDIEALH